MTGHTIYHIVRADFLERTRRFSFLATLGLAIYLGFLVNNGTIGVSLGKYRGEFNGAWVGAMMSIVATFFLSWFGFFLVKNSVQRDRSTGVGQIIATTPLGKLPYVAGKTLSNFAVLSVMVVILILAAILLLLLGDARSDFNLWQFVAPFLLLTIPSLAVVAAVAVLFECIAFLRGGMGNVVFFFGWMSILVSGMETRSDVLDISGLLTVSESMKEAANAAFADYGDGFVLGSSGHPVEGTFLWNGIAWTGDLLLRRLGWVGVACCVVGLASLVFTRFDPSREKLIARSRRAKKPRGSDEAEAVSSPAPVHHLRLTSLPTRSRFGAIVLAELRLMLKGLPWWRYAGAMILVVVCCTVPLNEARQFALPFAWIWPLLLWSSMGTREEQFRTHELVRSAPRSLQRQLPALLLAGVIVAAMTGSGILVRLLADGDLPGIMMWSVGVAFIPSLALASGVWSGSARLFEVLYMAMWYVGPLSKAAELDFIGAFGVTNIPSLPIIYGCATIVLCVLAFVGRKHKMMG
ncbi:MAG: hypothetical protein ACKVRP_04825 [Bacteroidota bacterium]